MAFDKLLAEVPPQPFLADGSQLGLIVIATPWVFKTRQTVVLRSTSIAGVEYQVKRVLDTALFVGPLDNDARSRSDVSAFTVVDSSTIEAVEQLKTFIPRDHIAPNFNIHDYAFESEPTDAERSLLVDLAGRPFDSTIVAGKRALVVSASVGDVLITYPTTPSIQNIDLGTANTETAIPLPAGTARFAVRARGKSIMRLAYMASGTDDPGPYWTIRAGSVYAEGDITVASLTLYLRATNANEVAEITSWS